MSVHAHTRETLLTRAHTVLEDDGDRVESHAVRQLACRSAFRGPTQRFCPDCAPTTRTQRHRPTTRRGAVRYVDLNWNMSTWISAKYPAFFDPARIRLLHYAHDAKPWRDEPTHGWMRPFWNLWDRFSGGAG